MPPLIRIVFETPVDTTAKKRLAGLYKGLAGLDTHDKNSRILHPYSIGDVDTNIKIILVSFEKTLYHIAL